MVEESMTMVGLKRICVFFFSFFCRGFDSHAVCSRKSNDLDGIRPSRFLILEVAVPEEVVSIRGWERFSPFLRFKFGIVFREYF